MSQAALPALKPRKTPRQARSTATLEAISEAAIQVLLAEGAGGLTTTRVAGKAGVSVGTMYQYFPNKHALLHCVLKQHLETLVAGVEDAARRLAGRKLGDVSDGLVAAYLDAKTESLAVSRALYRLAPELDMAGLQAASSKRIEAAVRTALQSAPDARFADIQPVVFTLLAAVTGATRTALERGASPAAMKLLTGELPKMCRAYLKASQRPSA